MNIGYIKLKRTLTSISKRLWVTRRDIRLRHTKRNLKIINHLINNDLIIKQRRKKIMRGNNGKAGNKFKTLKNYKHTKGYAYKLTVKGDWIKRLLLLLSKEDEDFKYFVMEKYIKEYHLHLTKKGKKHTKI